MSLSTTTKSLMRPGFDDPVMDSQASFRRLLDAMAQPGRVEAMQSDLEPPAPLQAAATAVCLTLLDLDTTLWLDKAARDSEGLRQFLAFHCGCPLVDEPAEAAFALITEPLTMPALESFGQGSAEYPDRSTTLIIQVRALHPEGETILSGPGIEDRRRFDATPLPLEFWEQACANHAGFPLGVDLIFATADRVAAVPRSTRLEIA